MFQSAHSAVFLQAPSLIKKEQQSMLHFVAKESLFNLYLNFTTPIFLMEKNGIFFMKTSRWRKKFPKKIYFFYYLKICQTYSEWFDFGRLGNYDRRELLVQISDVVVLWRLVVSFLSTIDLDHAVSLSASRGLLSLSLALDAGRSTLSP
ncbi:hypothetical protein BpHYR1_033183 [Brachionus plicatilis]|uniref:Uncharacterized protein n=1 Tax=Brachionus plicatilis TaxID=10195 RepID=A0A3M7QEA2_BRAPC|nr:hypothetical protein BpHYR1_033183 [Brachionus plicatilis]